MALVLKTNNVNSVLGFESLIFLCMGDAMTEQEIQEMIDKSIAKAMDKHNKTASLISAALGSVLLLFYAHGLITMVDKH